MGVDVENDFAARVRGHRRQEEGAGRDQERGQAGRERAPGARPRSRGRGHRLAHRRGDAPVNPNIQRVLFNEITKKAINEAIKRPLELDVKKYDSQQARRILDRLVGYQISPLLWNKVRRGLSAGPRAVGGGAPGRRARGGDQGLRARGVLDRRRRGRGQRPAAVHRPGGQARRREGRADQRGRGPGDASTRSQGAELQVGRRSSSKERRKYPPPPFITSKLQQEAASKLRFSPKRTMGLAQRLYEGVELGEEGPVGLITYMRTDSTRLSDDAVADVRALHRRPLRRRLPAGRADRLQDARRARRTPTRRSARPR